MTMPAYEPPPLPAEWHRDGEAVENRDGQVRAWRTRSWFWLQAEGGDLITVPDGVVRHLYPEDHRRAYDVTARADELAHRCQLALLEKAERDDRIAEADELLEAAAVLVLQLAPELRDAFAEALAEYGAKWTGEKTDEDR